MGRFLRVVTVVAFVASAACTRAGGNTPDPTVPTAPSTAATTTTAVPDIATIPAVIDEAYLNRVLAALDEVETQATRLIVATKQLPPEATALLNSVYSDEELAAQTYGWARVLADDPELKSFQGKDAARHSTVKELVSASPKCVFLVATQVEAGVDPQTNYLSLEPLDRSNDPGHHNPTAWMITTSGTNPDGSRPANPCVPS